MWMGGRPPLGYEIRDRKLEIVAAEAETVRHIFARYAELGAVLDLRDKLASAGITAKRHVSVAGNCGFRFKPAGYSDMKPAGVPI